MVFWAKALVLEDAEGDRGLLLTLDLVGIDRALSVSICRQITERFGLTRNQIAICTSHTHTGPVVGKNLAPMHYALVPESQQQLIDEYAEWLPAQVIDAVGRAIDDLETCKLKHGLGAATLKAPPYTPMSSPIRKTRSSRTISSYRPSLIASNSVTSSPRAVFCRCSGTTRLMLELSRGARIRLLGPRPGVGHRDVGIYVVYCLWPVRDGLSNRLLGGGVALLADLLANRQ